MYGRRLVPKCYTLKTSSVGSSVMTSWRFEASNDLVQWLTLDTRYGHLHTQDAFSSICKPGGTTTWGIDSRRFTKAERGGFSAFRVVQIDQNTGQSHTMSLAGLEIYG